ncbi:uncharacterized protein BDZ99DRAFT_467157 [Mytilinidion resinicola]|uniref:Uncharacterized protein n=1 Tax=Mytilinidion resinicola TaxID=574789 RepID=A0A6A6Y7Z5_9PEZI|nr:uncharacterized protein BDZ99DRAFT_467157 [Mytilinidion resinicola]KAF2804932.1 hypothetical protein BDZ99DRAFT_467157 [Mytilinidion resinicola]
MPRLDYEQNVCLHCKNYHYVVNPGAEASIFDILQTKQSKLGEDNEAILSVEVLQSHTQALKCQIEIEKKKHQATRDMAQERMDAKVSDIKRLQNEIDNGKRELEAERAVWKAARQDILNTLKQIKK